MSTPVTKSEIEAFNRDLCEALGLERCKRIELVAEAGCVTTVKATLVIPDEKLRAVGEVLKRYRLNIEEIENPPEQKSEPALTA